MRCGCLTRSFWASDMADKAPANSIGGQRLSEILCEIRGVDRMARGHIPERFGLAPIEGEPQFPCLAVVIISDQRQATVS